MVLRRAAQCFLLAVLAVPWPAVARADPEVHIERRQGVFRVDVTIPVEVDAQTAWQVLTDYNRLAEFVPDMRSSRVVSGAGEPLRVRQVGEAGVLFFRVDVDVDLQIEETPPEKLAFRAVGGNMKHMKGDWRIARTGQDIVLSYQAELEPGFWVPPLLGTALMRRDVGRQVAGVVNEMLRRHAGSEGKSTGR